MANLLESETYLLKISFWAQLGVQIPGYFCHRTEKISGRKHLTFKFPSFMSVYSLIILIASSIWDILFYARQASFSKYLQAGSPTEVYAYNVVVVYSSILSVYYVGIGLTNSKKFKIFWKENCELIEEMRTIYGKSNAEPKWFREVESSGKVAFFLLIIPVAVFLAIDNGYRIAESFVVRDGSNDDTVLALGLCFWNYVTMSGSGISTWITFFVQVYTASFKILAETVESLKLSENAITLEDFHTKTDIYIHEIFTKTWINPNEKRNKKFESGHHDKDQSATDQAVIKTLKVFQKIVRNVENFNDFYGIIMISETSICVLNLLVYLFFSFIWVSRGDMILILEAAVPIFIFAKELYDLGTVCEELTQSAEQVVKAFSDVPLEELSPHIHRKLQMLVTQYSSKLPAISAKQFFIVNRSLVTSILSALATFLVVLVQFKEADSEEAEEERGATNNTKMFLPNVSQSLQ